MLLLQSMTRCRCRTICGWGRTFCGLTKELARGNSVRALIVHSTAEYRIINATDLSSVRWHLRVCLFVWLFAVTEASADHKRQIDELQKRVDGLLAERSQQMAAYQNQQQQLMALQQQANAVARATPANVQADNKYTGAAAADGMYHALPMHITSSIALSPFVVIFVVCSERSAAHQRIGAGESAFEVEESSTSDVSDCSRPRL